MGNVYVAAENEEAALANRRWGCCIELFANNLPVFIRNHLRAMVSVNDITLLVIIMEVSIRYHQNHVLLSRHARGESMIINVNYPTRVRNTLAKIRVLLYRYICLTTIT
jgi:hypothetical protein